MHTYVYVYIYFHLEWVLLFFGLTFRTAASLHEANKQAAGHCRKTNTKWLQKLQQQQQQRWQQKANVAHPVGQRIFLLYSFVAPPFFSYVCLSLCLCVCVCVLCSYEPLNWNLCGTLPREMFVQLVAGCGFSAGHAPLLAASCSLPRDTPRHTPRTPSGNVCLPRIYIAAALGVDRATNR